MAEQNRKLQPRQTELPKTKTSLPEANKHLNKHLQNLLDNSRQNHDHLQYQHRLFPN